MSDKHPSLEELLKAERQERGRTARSVQQRERENHLVDRLAKSAVEEGDAPAMGDVLLKGAFTDYVYGRNVAALVATQRDPEDGPLLRYLAKRGGSIVGPLAQDRLYSNSRIDKAVALMHKGLRAGSVGARAKSAIAKRLGKDKE